jgi:hypothetical protein
MPFVVVHCHLVQEGSWRSWGHGGFDLRSDFTSW